MLPIVLSALLGSALACNPMTATCPPIPAMPSSVQYDLTTSNPDFEYVLPAGISSPSQGTLAFTLKKQGDAPTLVTNDYLLYGNIKATIKTAPGVGMVSAFILMSENLDEIDYEWLGAYNNQVQTNYFYEGVTANYDRGGVSDVATPQDVSHVYEIDWTETTLRWLIDDVVIRTLNKADTTNYGYPSSPCQIKIGVWASGDPTNPEGTISWGGGLLDYSKAPYTMTLSALSVTSYTNAKSFVYASDGKSVSLSQTIVSTNSSSASSSAASASSTMAGQAIQNVKQGTVSSAASSARAGSTMSTQRVSSATAAAATASSRVISSAAAATSSSPTISSAAGINVVAVGGTSAVSAPRTTAGQARASSSSVRVSSSATAMSNAAGNLEAGQSGMVAAGAAAAAAIAVGLFL